MTSYRPVLEQLCKSCRTCFMFYCMFYFTCDRSFSPSISPSVGRRSVQWSVQWSLSPAALHPSGAISRRSHENCFSYQKRRCCSAIRPLDHTYRAPAYRSDIARQPRRRILRRCRGDGWMATAISAEISLTELPPRPTPWSISQCRRVSIRHIGLYLTTITITAA